MKYLQLFRDLVIIITCVIVIDTCRLTDNFYKEMYDLKDLTVLYHEITFKYQDLMVEK